MQFTDRLPTFIHFGLPLLFVVLVLLQLFYWFGPEGKQDLKQSTQVLQIMKNSNALSLVENQIKREGKHELTHDESVVYEGLARFKAGMIKPEEVFVQVHE